MMPRSWKLSPLTSPRSCTSYSCGGPPSDLSGWVSSIAPRSASWRVSMRSTRTAGAVQELQQAPDTDLRGTLPFFLHGVDLREFFRVEVEHPHALLTEVMPVGDQAGLAVVLLTGSIVDVVTMRPDQVGRKPPVKGT